MENITLQSIIVRKKEIVASNMDGEIVMMSIETGKYYNIGEMGGVIWTMIEKPMQVEDVVLDLLENYRVTRQQCEEEVLSFVNEIGAQGLIEIQ